MAHCFYGVMLDDIGSLIPVLCLIIIKRDVCNHNVVLLVLFLCFCYFCNVENIIK